MTQPWAKVLRILLFSRQPRSLREIADLAEMSPSGVQDVLRRFKEAELISATRSGNKILFVQQLGEDELLQLQCMFNEHDHLELQKRAEVFSNRSTPAIAWIDETLEFLRQAKVANAR